MNIQTSATAVQSAAFPQNMSNVIDSLKRLERIGSEESQTVQKILEAADELSVAICKHFPENLNRLTMQAHLDHTGQIVLGDYCFIGGPTGNQPRHHFGRYHVDSGALMLLRGNSYVFVGANRDTALAFSKDIANGLLDVIVRFIEKEHVKSKAGLDSITTAVRNLTGDPE